MTKTITRLDIRRIAKNNSTGSSSSSGSGGGGGSTLIVDESGSGNAYTAYTHESNKLTLKKDKTLVDTDTDQTIGGTKTFSNTVWGADFRLSSDQRLKDFKDFIKLGLEQIANAPIIEYTWKDERDKEVHGGTYAQYWEKIAPWAVSKDIHGHLGISYETLAMASAVELAREIVNLKQEIAELKKTITELSK